LFDHVHDDARSLARGLLPDPSRGEVERDAVLFQAETLRRASGGWCEMDGMLGDRSRVSEGGAGGEGRAIADGQPSDGAKGRRKN
jgi:hypothetical protein